VNALQRWIVAGGILVFLVMGAYPPWKGTVSVQRPKVTDAEIRLSFAPLYAPPKGLLYDFSFSTGSGGSGRGFVTSVHIDWQVLAVEWIVAVVFTGGLLVIAAGFQGETYGDMLNMLSGKSKKGQG